MLLAWEVQILIRIHVNLYQLSVRTQLVTMITAAIVVLVTRAKVIATITANVWVI